MKLQPALSYHHPPESINSLVSIQGQGKKTLLFGSKGVCALGKAPPNTDKKGSCYCPLWKRNGFFYCFYMFPFAFLGKLYYSLSLAVTCLIEKKLRNAGALGKDNILVTKKTCEDERKGCYMNAVEQNRKAWWSGDQTRASKYAFGSLPYATLLMLNIL